MKTNLILTVLLLFGDWYFLNSLFNAPTLLCILIVLIFIFIGYGQERMTVRINQAIRLDQMPVNSYSMFYKQVIEDIQLPYPDIQFYYLEDDAIKVTHYGIHTIVVTKGMLNLHDEDALRACISHECGHIYNRDILFRQVVSLNILALIFFVLLFYSSMLVFLFIMLIVLLIFLNFYMTIRDYEADEYAVSMDEDNRYGLIHYLNRYEPNSYKRVKKLEDTYEN